MHQQIRRDDGDRAPVVLQQIVDDPVGKPDQRGSSRVLPSRSFTSRSTSLVRRRRVRHLAVTGLG
ncbi:hypothetical protein, partial [Enterococcus faecalis]|uniref:hypothetical protein n=1 Tax=Enterococcus faecalis TaxID=1351 RepID=UPI003D6B8E75